MKDKLNDAAIRFDKVRSYKSCVRDGIKFVRDNFTYLLKLLWPIALAEGLILGGGLAGLMNVSNDRQWIVELLIVILTLVVVSAGVGITLHALKFYTKEGALPARTISMLKNSLPIVFRYLTIKVIAVGLLAAMAYGLSGYTLYGVAIFILLILPLLTFFLINILMANDEEQESIKDISIMTMRHYGSTFLIIIVLVLFFSVAFLFLFLPGSILMFVEIKALMAKSMGDEIDLPAMFGALQFICWFVGGTLSIAFLPTAVTPMFCHYSSIVVRKKELKQIENQQRNNEEERQRIKNNSYHKSF